MFLVISGGVFSYWAYSGANMVTQYQVQETVVETDEFGDEIERTRMKDQFQFGLLPDKPYDGAVTLGGLPGGLGVVLILLSVFRARAGNEGETD